MTKQPTKEEVWERIKVLVKREANTADPHKKLAITQEVDYWRGAYAALNGNLPKVDVSDV